MPTTSACYDTEPDMCVTPAHLSLCYDDDKRANCCATCKDAYDIEALFRCEYGDKREYCKIVTKDNCLELVSIWQIS